METISQKTAQQIVDTVKEICGYDINFIGADGIIYASTDQERVDTYHEAAHQAAREGRMIEVEDERVYGAHPGVNLPFSYRGQVAGVIGITGRPEQVRRFAYLAQRITALILREHELEQQQRGRQAESSYVVQSLISGKQLDHGFLLDYLEKNHLFYKEKFRCLVFKLDREKDMAAGAASPREVEELFERAGSSFFQFSFPGNFVLLLGQRRYLRVEGDLRAFVQDRQNVRAAVGSPQSLERMRLSYQEALMALRFGAGSRYVLGEELTLELAAGAVPGEVRDVLLKRTVAGLSEREREWLEAYFAEDLSLKRTAQRLYVHKNTLQYQLNRVRERTGLDPRKFREAAALYMGLLMAKS